MINKDALKNLKLVVCDLDGTLLDNSGQIGIASKKLIKELQSIGLNFSFATGRLHSAIINYAKELEIKTPLISLDGSYIKGCCDDKIYFESFISEKHVQKSLLYADKYLLKIVLCHGDAIYYTEDNSVVPNLVEKFGAAFEEIGSYSKYISKTLEIVMISDYKDNLKYVYERLNFPYTWGLTTNFYKTHTNEGIYCLEIRKKGSSKATGLLKLSRHLKINIRETAVIGDWYNDKSMFETNAVKIALANSVPELKYSADFITSKDNNEDGVAEFLEMILRAKKNKN